MRLQSENHRDLMCRESQRHHNQRFVYFRFVYFFCDWYLQNVRNLNVACISLACLSCWLVCVLYRERMSGLFSLQWSHHDIQRAQSEAAIRRRLHSITRCQVRSPLSQIFLHSLERWNPKTALIIIAYNLPLLTWLYWLNISTAIHLTQPNRIPGNADATIFGKNQNWWKIKIFC